MRQPTTTCTEKHIRKTPGGNPLESAADDPDLARIVAAWPQLPDAIRAGIVAMVDAMRK